VKRNIPLHGNVVKLRERESGGDGGGGVGSWQRKRNLNGSCMAVGSSVAPTNKCQKHVIALCVFFECLQAFLTGNPFSLSVSLHTLQRLFGSIISTAKTKIKSCNLFIILHFLQN